jgi:hypothetical protein
VRLRAGEVIRLKVPVTVRSAGAVPSAIAATRRRGHEGHEGERRQHADVTFADPFARGDLRESGGATEPEVIDPYDTRRLLAFPMRTSAFANGQTWDLPVPAQGASTHARFFDPAGPPSLAISCLAVWGWRKRGAEPLRRTTVWSGSRDPPTPRLRRRTRSRERLRPPDIDPRCTT